MRNVMQYSIKNRLSMRLAMLCLVVVGGITFMILSRNDVSASGDIGVLSILGIVFSSLALVGMIIICALASESTAKLIAKPPNNYLMALAPISAWKKLVGYIIPTVIIDSISIGISIAFVVLLSIGAADGTYLSDVDWFTRYSFLGTVFVLLGYVILLTAGMFWYTLCETVLRNIPGRKIVAAIIVVILLCALSWVNIVTLPFGEIYRIGLLMFTVTITQLEVWHIGVIIVSLVVQAVIALGITAHLMDRRS